MELTVRAEADTGHICAGTDCAGVLRLLGDVEDASVHSLIAAFVRIEARPLQAARCFRVAVEGTEAVGVVLGVL
jgi:hypothetical protein